MRHRTSKSRATGLAAAVLVMGATLAGCGSGGAPGVTGTTVTSGNTAADGPGSGTAPASAAATSAVKPPAGDADLASPALRQTAMELVSSAENSTVNWKSQYSYIQDIGDGRGYTAGLIGFCSATGDMLQLVTHYTDLEPHNPLARYLPALQALNDSGSSGHDGLDPGFVADWHRAAADPVFRRAQNDELDSTYFNPAVNQAKADGLNALGQFIYYDAMVMHGPGSDSASFGGIRAAALKVAKTPAQGGDERRYLEAFLDARRAVMKADPSHQDTSRIDTEQRAFLNAGNLKLAAPLHWTVNGDSFTIAR